MFNPTARSMNAAIVLAVVSAAAYADNAHERAVSANGKALFGHTHAPDPLAAGIIQRLEPRALRSRLPMARSQASEWAR